MERLQFDMETQNRFVYFKQSRQPGEGFGSFCDRVGFEPIREFAASYEFQTAAEAEITDDSDGLVEETDYYYRDQEEKQW